MSAHKSPRGRKRAGRRARAAVDRMMAAIAREPGDRAKVFGDALEWIAPGERPFETAPLPAASAPPQDERALRQAQDDRSDGDA